MKGLILSFFTSISKELKLIPRFISSPCVNADCIILAIYVDDGIVVTLKLMLSHELKIILEKEFNMIYEGEINSCVRHHII